MKYVELTIAAALCLASAPAATEEAQSFPKEQIAAGAELYSVNCSPCHGARMQDPARLSTCANSRPTNASASSIR